MTLPLYRVLEIYDAEKTALWAKLANALIGSQPVAVDISKLGNKEKGALELIEEYLKRDKARPFPYPLYIVSSVKEYGANLEVFPNMDLLPAFFKRKNRPLNMKENFLMAKVNLKQNKLENINTDETAPVISNYGKSHKMIFKKQSYLDFLTEIQNELKRGSRGKK